MPKVLRIINRLNLGGPSFNAAYLSKYLQPEFETLLVSGMKDDSEESSEYIVKNLGLHPVYLPEMYRELNPFKDYKSYYKLRKIIDEFQPDIVHTHAAKAGAVGRLAAIHSGVPVIVHTFHGHVFHSYFNAAKTRLFLEIERYLAKRSTRIIAISESQKHELCNTYNIAPSEKCEIVPLGFDLEKFNTNKDEKRKLFRSRYNIGTDDIAIGITGRLVPVKNHYLFLNSIQNVTQHTNKKIRAFVIGDGEERDKLEQHADAIGLSRKGPNPTLTFTSWIKDIDVSNAGMDIIALTSNNEGTPVSLIEAQASGKPIVATNVGGVANIVIDNGTALLSPRGEQAAFNQNLLRLVEDTNLRNKLSGTSTQYVLGQFSYQRLCRDMAALYNRLLTDKRTLKK